MTLWTKESGVWRQTNDLFIKADPSGIWAPVQVAYVKDAGVWKQYFQAEIVVHVTANYNGLIVGNSDPAKTQQGWFSIANWTSTKRKRLIINPGVVINPQPWGSLAIQDGGQGGPTWGGDLIIENYGTIQGNGGSPNSGTGGDAMYPEPGGTVFTKKAIVYNYGTIRAGGGGGGQGGQGGTGYWQQEFLEGPRYGSNSVGRWVAEYTNNRVIVWWDGSQRLVLGGAGNTEGAGNDGWRYYRGNFRVQPDGSAAHYEVLRRRWEDRYQAGAAGGAGGRGQGADGVNTGGSVGGNNGGNSGTGGTGGAGGGWGNAGSPGATGAAGNAGGGTGGAGGGPAGIAYHTGIMTMTNSGTIQGRVT